MRETLLAIHILAPIGGFSFAFALLGTSTHRSRWGVGRRGDRIWLAARSPAPLADPAPPGA